MTRKALGLALSLLATSAIAAPATQGPPPRPLTDPASIASPAGDAPVPVSPADLFDTRGIDDAAWTADGSALVVSTNLTGRYNLWRIPAQGGAPGAAHHLRRPAGRAGDVAGRPVRGVRVRPRRRRDLRPSPRLAGGRERRGPDLDAGRDGDGRPHLAGRADDRLRQPGQGQGGLRRRGHGRRRASGPPPDPRGRPRKGLGRARLHRRRPAGAGRSGRARRAA